MTRLDLPEGAWAELRDPAKIPEKYRRPALIAFNEWLAATREAETLGQGQTARSLTADSEFCALLIFALVTAWSYELPVTVESVDEMDGDARRVLARHALDMLDRVFPQFSPTLETAQDPKAPTDV